MVGVAENVRFRSGKAGRRFLCSAEAIRFAGKTDVFFYMEAFGKWWRSRKREFSLVEGGVAVLALGLGDSFRGWED
jgi:hypothetical protein